MFMILKSWFGIMFLIQVNQTHPSSPVVFSTCTYLEFEPSNRFTAAVIWPYYFTNCSLLLRSLGVRKYPINWKSSQRVFERNNKLEEKYAYLLGRLPNEINIKNRMFGFWLSIVNGKETKLSNILYKILLHDCNSGIYEHKWIRYIRDILISVGRIDLFHKSYIDNPRSVKASISRALTDVHIYDWGQKMNSTSKGKSYNYLKQDLNFENYLINLDKNIIYLLLNSELVIIGYLSRQVAGKIYL